ncbi:hypothetical protein D3C73_736490 [compost metagenome]
MLLSQLFPTKFKPGEPVRKEVYKMFKVSDFWGIIAGMFALIFLYLILSNSTGSRSILTSLFSGTNDLTKTLQGR